LLVPESQMSMQTPETLLIVTVAAFVLGWLVAKVGAYLGKRVTASERDPRDDRIRSLDAELRIARTECEKTGTALEQREQELTDATRQLDDAAVHLNKQEEIIQTLRKDLRDSVRKTRDLRAELSELATENLRSEVKLREVETELSVAQASTDLIATGVLDYSVAPAGEDIEMPKVQQSAT
jgi:chromosome segregation ATPase